MVHPDAGHGHSAPVTGVPHGRGTRSMVGMAGLYGGTLDHVRTRHYFVPMHGVHGQEPERHQ
ncbi:hypothetical protein ACFFX0_14600 [Citricoccus parietis]|uniref:Uncharacterized protein n=1 Tax=Citricoccus parietis TaxID=592307 RepID=A0ABV5G094_9MICC